jgi:hypothetical protein
MAVSREKLIHEKRLESHLTEFPEYVIEYIQAKKRAKYSLGYAAARRTFKCKSYLGDLS